MQDDIEHWRRADRIVRQALELSGTSRAGFVAEACGDDRELRELVERLLREGERTGELRTGAALNRALGEQDAERLLAEAGALLEPGSRIGHYEIEERIGAGGMGLVYRASDVRLKRPVAIKALSPHLAADATALARFRREAEILATVSDPGIAAVYSLEEHEGASYLVMEYVAGETLAERLERGALSLERSLDLARQMAGALELAHGRGVVHRDLKPGNVMLDDDGNVKLVDFGLARLVPGYADGDDGSEATTRVQRLTSSGMLVGTAPYMSPEQVRGARTDQRTDVWAFGCVLYEMIGGVSPFRREIPVDTLTAILRQDPEWARLPSATPASLRRLLRRCLEKDPDRRLRHLGDARLELDQAGEELASGAPPLDAATGTPPPGAATGIPPPHAAATTPSTGPGSALRDPRVLALAGAALFLGALGAWAWLRPGPAPTTSEVATRLVVPLPAGQRLVVGEGARPLALSPDGRTLAYVAEDSGVARLHLRDLGRFDSRAVEGTEGAQQPFFSPDGRRVGFFADGVVKVVAVSGGSPITVGPGPTIPKGGSWGSDDRIVWAGKGGELHGLPATGGASEPLVEAGDDGDWYQWPEVLPGSRGILFAAGGLDEGRGSGIAVRTPDGEIRLLGPGQQPRYLPTGHLVYYEEGERLRLVPFDLERLRVTGAAVSAVDDVFRAWAGGGAYFAVSETGTLVFVAAGLDRSLVWVDRDGRATPAVEEVRGFRFPRLSPDGDRVAVTIDPRPSEIWVYDLTRGSRVRLARGGHSILSAWGPGGAEIAYSSDVDDGLSRIFRRSVDGGGEAELLVGGDLHVYPMSWSNEGRYLAYVESHPTRRLDVWVADVGGAGDPIPIATGAAGETAARFSPDGRWLAYQSDETGRNDVYLVSFPPGRGDRTVVSTGGGFDPVWSADGTELFYRRGDELVAVDVETVGAGIELGEPRVLFRGPYDATQSMNYSVSPDGDRFLMVLPDPDAGLDRFHVVLDWFAEISGAS